MKKTTSSDSFFIPQSNLVSSNKIVTGSFIQPYLYWRFDENRWDNEFSLMNKMGIDTIIMGDIAVKHSNDEGWDINYHSTLPEFKDFRKYDALTHLFHYCKKYKMKLYLGLGLDGTWWKRDLSTDDDSKWLLQMCKLHAEIAKDLYNQCDKYGDVFGGYYWVYEVWNHVSWNRDETREAYAQTLSKAFNTVLDAIDSVDKKRPLLFSPFSSREGHSRIENMTKFYTRFFELTHFRKYDIMAPMDNVGGGGQTIDTVEAWTKAYYDAFQNSGNKLQFWSNCECFEQSTWCPAPVNRFAKQLEISRKYCKKIISFAWNHYYSPFVTNPGFNKALIHYEETGELVETSPKLPSFVKVSGKDAIEISTSGFSDDYGVYRYRFYKVVDGEELLLEEKNTGRTDCAQNKAEIYIDGTFSSITYSKDRMNIFILEAYNCFGNASRVYIPVTADGEIDKSNPFVEGKGYLTEDEFNNISTH